jgi:hypothetical protein
MEGYLNTDQAQYVLFHLGLMFQLSDEIKSRFVFVKSSSELPAGDGQIVFPLSADSLNNSTIKTVNEIPVLFPCGPSLRFWRIENNTLFFEDDLLKSAFYLLSGYQEYVNKKRDMLGRFSALDSIQYQLNVVQKPVVNYYFEEIGKGICEFLELQHLSFEKRSLFDPFGLIITHDVDRVRYYSLNYLIYKLKELAGIKKAGAGFPVLFRQLYRGLCGYLSGKSNDPAWKNFSFLGELESEHQISSVYFFLDNETPHHDADYKLSDARISGLIADLDESGCEIGVHGNHYSATSKASMKRQLLKLKRVFPKKISGIRQHRLRYEIPATTSIHEESGFDYDATLGFYDYEGFRNSFCMPFRLYNFEKNSMSAVWEIPLHVMDCTLLDYRKLDFQEAKSSIDQLISEIRRFSGIFTLLWHNSYFDEIRYPGIKQFYTDVISHLAGQHPQKLLGTQVIEKMNAAL